MKKSAGIKLNSIFFVLILSFSLINVNCELGNNPEKSEDPSEAITMEIVTPADGEFFPGCVVYNLITVEALPVKYVSKVELYVNDVLIKTDEEAPYVFEWNPHDFMPDPDPLAYLMSLLEETPALKKLFENMPPEILNWILTQLIQKHPKFQELMAAKDMIHIKAIAYDKEDKTVVDEVSVEAEESDYNCSCYSKIITCFENISKKNPVPKCFDLAEICCQECAPVECCYSQCQKTKSDAREACSTIFMDDPSNEQLCIMEAEAFDCEDVCDTGGKG